MFGSAQKLRLRSSKITLRFYKSLKFVLLKEYTSKLRLDNYGWWFC